MEDNHRARRGARNQNSPDTPRSLMFTRRLRGVVFVLFFLIAATRLDAQTTPPPTATSSEATPQTSSIVERQRARLNSDSIEERIDAVLRLGALNRPEASRAAATALDDRSPRVRSTATKALRALPSAEAAGLLFPKLSDRDEFVRQEAAYALGETSGVVAENIVSGLLAALEKDKSAGVRGAAAVTLGRLRDRRAVAGLIASLTQQRRAGGILNRVRGRSTSENEFVRRAAARSLGMIGDREAVPALIATLGDERAELDVRREAARSLGMLGDARAISALRGVEQSTDASLSRAAFESLEQIRATGRDATNPPAR